MPADRQPENRQSQHTLCKGHIRPGRLPDGAPDPSPAERHTVPTAAKSISPTTESTTSIAVTIDRNAVTIDRNVETIDKNVETIDKNAETAIRSTRTDAG